MTPTPAPGPSRETSAIKRYGQPATSRFVIVAHGNELHAFSRLNRAVTTPLVGMYR